MTSPLAGRRVVNTRAAHQAGELDALLAARGAIPLRFPCIAIGPPADPAPLDDALRELAGGGFAWIALTSANTVEAIARRIDSLGIGEPLTQRVESTEGIAASSSRTREPARGSLTPYLLPRDSSPGPASGDPPSNVSAVGEPLAGSLGRHPGAGFIDGPRPLLVAVVGPATAAAVARTLGWPVAFLPSVETAANLGAELPVAPGDGVLLPKSAIGGSALAAILEARRARVTEVVAYVTTLGSGGIDLASILESGGVDAICLTSPSTGRGLLDRLGGSVDLAGVRVACIGTETAAAARGLGLRVDVVPGQHTAEAMVEALAASFAIDES